LEGRRKRESMRGPVLTKDDGVERGSDGGNTHGRRRRIMKSKMVCEMKRRKRASNAGKGGEFIERR